jgi:hypothetical protein
MRLMLRTPALCLLLASAACAGGSSSGEPAPDSRGKVRIENRSSLNMDIYIRKTFASPVRLGYVPASETVEFTLAPALIAGSASFRLEGRPVRAGGDNVLSEPFTAGTGEEIFWSIPPQ